ncbi:mannose-1-phosphate guanylyltransferase [Algimonas ampicilliniresistens]|jgi:MurNAc alpha-1-phosphate uridylyltransferase|uniref:Mannose-1-phosphate guanylyltransferase n=1 Tax=Algimonas ampicilliniresistens TaxID=1298735 RepID=A0ABQ5V5T5_9PROT|nr:nucleotidyltransferase family protein [Algimonas ampicilliniresistens]GLQ22908.1 mannose-1-phosphate guanylyltransferase [Algimonas ampicilliniresistens]
MIKTAMVMAAGHGTRMRPLTDDRSKAMVEVGGRPLVDHMLDRLADAGVERAIVNVHAHADHLEDHLKTRSGGPEIIISDERGGLLETGGGVVKALPLLGDNPVLICNIDAVWVEFAPVIKALFEAWDADEMDELLLLAPKPRTLGYPGVGDFDMDRDGRLSWRSGDKAFWVYAGVQIFKPTLAHGYPETKFSRTKIWKKSIERRRVFGLPIPGFWMHIGDPDTLKAAEAVLADPNTLPV